PRVMSFLLARALEEGIETGYARELILRRKLVPDSPPYHIEHWPWPLRIFTFGGISVERDGAPLKYSRKAPKKPLELLRLLVARGGKNVREDRLAELLWPDAEGDVARTALNVTVLRLRELLAVKGALQVADGSVSIDDRLVWIDTRAFEKLLQTAEQAPRVAPDQSLPRWGGAGVEGRLHFGMPPYLNPLPPGERAGVRGKAAIRKYPSAVVQNLEKAVHLYRGPFLADEDASWSIGPRERFREAFLGAIEALGNLWERKMQWRKAVEVYRRGLAVDDLIEQLHIRIMACLLRLGARAEALAAYRRLRKTLKAYGVEPSEETEAVYRQIIGK
ncbi:MAG: BTAD domain-containing putative transcriptional regulator, partial [Nitrospirota bacterium]